MFFANLFKNDLGFICAFFSDRNRANLIEIAQKLPKNAIFIFREYDLNQRKRQELAEKIFAICKKNGVKFLIGKDFELAKKIGADGFHFSDFDDFSPNFDDFDLVTYSCHSLKSVEKAQKLRVDAIFLSPIFATKSHVEAKALGILELKKACAASKIPVFALGGISAENLKDIAKSGAAGFGAISFFTPSS